MGNAQFQKANLRRAKLYESNLTNSNLSEMKFRWATVRQTDLRGADLTRTETSQEPKFVWNSLRHEYNFRQRRYQESSLNKHIIDSGLFRPWHPPFPAAP